MRNAVHSLWVEPRAPQPPARVWRDWALVAVLVPSAVLETIFRDDLVWRPVALVLCVAGVFTLLWRRTKPLVMVAVAFGATAALDLATSVGTDGSADLYTSACLLLLPYALFRWGTGREAVIGLAIVLASCLLTEFSNFSGFADVVGGVVFLLFVATLGASVRYRTGARLREKERVKLREREQLARELHDTVAHYVSAIVIRAQAGRALAASRPAAAVDALAVIEEAACRTLAEMRTIVGVLRRGEEPDLAPQRGVADIARLARGAGDAQRVDVELSGDLDGLTPPVEAALYRLAQETITNAVRHARHATRIHVRLAGDDDCVRLTVRDDGDAGSAGWGSSGFGLVGMAERATLLGGTFEAGPSGAGWTVDAVLPRTTPVR